MILLAALYFLVYAMMGVYAPWLPPFLAAKGLKPDAIGVALAAVSICRVVFPPAWGALADRVGHQRWLLTVTALVSGVTVAGLVSVTTPTFLILGLLAYGFFLTPVVPLLEAATLNALGTARHLYGRIRLWGSIGFILSSIGLGWLISFWGIGSVAVFIGIPLVAFGLIAWRAPVPDRPSVPKEHTPWHALPWRLLAPVLLASMLGQASHGPYYAFFTLQMTNAGASTLATGTLWALGVIAETIIMAVSPKLFVHVTHISAIRWALILSAVRWLVFASTNSLALIALGQTLHAASYALLHLATVQWVDANVPPSRRSLGQSVLSASSYGLGIGGGLALAGIMATPLGTSGLYTAATASCLLGWLVVRFGVR